MSDAEKSGRGRQFAPGEPRDASAVVRDGESVHNGHGSLESLLLRQQEAAQLCGVSAREFRRWVARGFAPAPIVAHGGRPLWSRAALARWVDELELRAQRRGGVR